MKILKKILTVTAVLFIASNLFADPFNSRLTDAERAFLEEGDVLIKNINYEKYMCLINDNSELSDILFSEIHDLKPKYLAEVIQYKPYKGNEDLPQKLGEILDNVPDYAGIPYYSVRAEEWYDLYDSAEITSTTVEGNKKNIKAVLEMSPFGTVEEDIDITKADDTILYVATNKSLLRYYDKFDCVKPDNMKIAIYLFRDGDRWILYGIGGVHAMRVPFFTERIQTSFINRINTFCSFIFKKF